MPIIRKIIEVGTSKAVTIPKSWLDYYEEQLGEPLEKVAMEVNGVLTITPISNNKGVKKHAHR